jgi:tetratricopeptide (TPR) repeat protein/predicted Ser/Thr protein kinase
VHSLDETQAGAETIDEFGVLTHPSRQRAALEAGEVIGRYVILAKLGAGGMGVVYAAYDPELDRKVALKLLRRDGDGSALQGAARARLLREAQALAKFSHPEIVTVHDVGEHESGVWVAMEFVDGETLGGWAKQTPRSWQEVLAVMQATGRGVAAAHAAGLVHRDLKPDNIMISADGRVRVMDFGLTRGLDEDEPDGEGEPHEQGLSQATRHGGLLGTPAYMAPEQFSGGEVTAASDQFSYCVTMWELLYGERPFRGSTIAEIVASVLDGRVRIPPKQRGVPIWLRKICERGLAREPGQRWPSMAALLQAFERGEARVRTRKLGIGLALLAGLALGVVGWRQYEHARAIDACTSVGASIDDSWNDATRERVRQSLVATGLNYAPSTADTVIPYLDAQAQAWRDGRTQACMHAEVEHSWDLTMSERALWCLDDRRLAFESLITELARADADITRSAIMLATSLELVGSCVDERVLDNLPDPPDAASRAELEQLRVEFAHAGTLLAAGKFVEGLAVIRPARARAEQLDWPPLLASVREREGLLLAEATEFAASEAMLSDAYVTAANAGVWEAAADSAIELIEIVGDRQARFAEGRMWALHARVAIHHAEDPLQTRAARLATNLGHLELSAGRYAEAEALYQSAYEIWLALLGEDHPTLGVHLNNLGNLHHAQLDRVRAKQEFERALALRENVLGPDHPDIAGNLHNLGLIVAELGDHEQARQLFERALGIWQRSVGLDHFNAAVTLTSLGNLAYQAGDLEQAEQDYTRSLEIMEKVLGPEHLSIASLLNNLANVASDRSEYEKTKQLHLRALAIREKAGGPDHPSVAISLFNLAMLHVTMGERSEAKPLLERALVITEATYGADHPETAWTLGELGDIEVELGEPAAALPRLERALVIFDANPGNQGGEATTRFALARALVATGGDRERAKRQAEAAREGFRELERAGAKNLLAVEQWLTKGHSLPPRPASH